MPAVSAKLQITPKVLFLPYLVVPVFLLILTANYFLHLNLQQHLPQSPQQVFILSIIFEKPHIVASSMILLDPEYLRFYHKKIIIHGTVVAGLIAVILLGAGIGGFYAFFYAWTIYHVGKQQIGVGKMLNRQPSKLYDAWGWVFLSTSLLIAASIGFIAGMPSWLNPRVLYGLIMAGGAVSIVLAVILTTKLESKLGKYYLGANTALVLGTTLAFATGFPFFAILLPRLVHDFTAYTFYIDHDTNRNKAQAHQLVYKLTNRLSLPIWLVCLVVSVGLAFLIVTLPPEFAVPAAVILTLIHYTTEAFTWKGGGIHRKYLAFKLQPS